MYMLLAIRQRWHRRNLLRVDTGPESYVVAPHYFSYPPPLIGWYKRGQSVNARPTFRLY